MSEIVAVIREIRISELELRTRLGVTEAERAQPQRVLCNITLLPDRAENLQDQIDATVDYAAVAGLVRQISNANVYRLLETMAEEMTAQIATRFEVRWVTIELRKFALRDASYVSVTSSREEAA